MREFLTRIFKSAIENWLVSLITTAGVAIGGWLLWLYRAYLKDGLLSNRYAEMPGWLWVLIVLAISIIPALLVFLIMRRKTQRRKKIFTDETDIKNALRQWFRQRYVEVFRRMIGEKEIVHFSSLDQKLGLALGSAKRYLEGIVEEFDDWRTKNETQDTIEIESI
jgi:hypothetical protein